MATIKDVADAAGVSIGTVDRIIHNRGRFSDSTAEKVRLVMQELEYSPNMHARGLKKAGNISLTVILPQDHQDAGYWKTVYSGIAKAVQELGSLCREIEIIRFDRYSEASCNEVIDRIKHLQSNGFLIAPVFHDNCSISADDIKPACVLIDTDNRDFGRRLTYIGQDSRSSGALSAKLMHMIAVDLEGYLLIAEPPGHNEHIRGRVEGFRTFLETKGLSCRIKTINTGSDDEADYHRHLDRFFKTEKNLPAGIFVPDSSVYYFGSWLKSSGEQFSSIPLIGYDLISERRNLIDEEVINFIITQQPEEQAYRGMKLLYDAVVLGGSAPGVVYLPMNIITKENLNTF